jgi:clan AA aspartic protease
MGLIYAEVELINSVDIVNARRYIIGEEEVRSMRVTMLVDSGSFMMVINETIMEYLGLPIKEKGRAVQLADGSWVEYDVVGPIDVKFADRQATCNAFVLPGDCEPLLGAIPMEEMDVIIHPSRQELIVHPGYPRSRAYRL